MEPASSITAAEFESLRERLARIEQRLQRLEGLPAQPVAPPAARSEATAGPPETAAPSAAAIVEWAPLLGKTLLILGGAFVLRAATGAEILVPLLGASLGILYAVGWFLMAARSASRGSTAAAVWHGIAGSIVAFPLLWETTIQFGLLTPLAAAVATGAITSVGLWVSWRHRLAALAAIVSLASAVTLLALAQGTRLPVPFTAMLLCLALATLLIGYARNWPALPWLAAVPAQLMVAMMTGIVLIAEPERSSKLLSPGSAVALQFALVILFVGTFAARTLIKRSEVQAPELTLGLSAMVVGLGGGIAVAREFPFVAFPLGLAAALFALALYAVSFRLIDRGARRTNFIFYSSVALVCAFVSAVLLLPAGLLSVVLVLGALLMAGAGARFQRATLSLHGAVYATGAAFASGLLPLSLRAMTIPELVPAVPVEIAVWVALAGSILYCAFPVASHGRTWGRLSSIPKLVVLAIALLGLAGLSTLLVAGLLPRQEAAAQPQALAVLRTAILAVAAVALAWLGRSPRLVQASWLVYPLLIAGGIKLLVEDLRVGDPAILVASFALYGGALVFAPRLARKTAKQSISPG